MNSARSWYQKALLEKNIISIHPIKSKNFVSYEVFVLSYDELSEITSDEVLYSDWHAALKSINDILSWLNVTGKITLVQVTERKGCREDGFVMSRQGMEIINSWLNF